jgi:hypothetical protein
VEWNWLSLTDCGCRRPSHVIVSLARTTRRRTAAALHLNIEPTQDGEAPRPNSEIMVQLEDDAAALAEALARR